VSDRPTYKNVTATVRPARCAILINQNSPYWKTAVSGAIACASEVWGGRHFLIVPTDGAQIKDKFWELLEAYSPDYIALYRLTFADLEFGDPDKYATTKDNYKKSFDAQGLGGGFDEWFSDSAASSAIDELNVSDRLQKELLARLSPLHHGGRAVDEVISRRNGFGYPFTKIADIAPHAIRRPDEVTLVQELEDATLALLVHSHTGFADEEYRASLAGAGLNVRGLPNNYEADRIIADIFGASTGNYMPKTPFGLSMLHLGQYYRVDLHHDYKEPVVVVLGDTVDDFCFYYSLSRLHDKVCWLPLTWLRSCSRGVARQKQSIEQRLSRTLVNLFFQLIDYGHHEKRIELRSMSLTMSQLTTYKRQMAKCSYGDPTDYEECVDCVPIEEPSTACILQVFEENNYVNHSSVVFQDGEAVSPFATPKPKNFSKIEPSQHYWMTSLRIEDYQPPSLPSLGAKIVSTKGLGIEARVATDGIAYHCPSVAYFGGDIDVNLVRPNIRMPEAMDLLGTYFAEAGITIRYSDKGNYFIDTIDRFGGLDEVGQFIRDPGTRSILDNFKAVENDPDGHIIYLDNDRRAYVNLDSLARSVNNKEEAANLADRLVGKRILQRGYILQCQRCRLSSWYSLDVLTADFVCGRCSFRQLFTRQHWKHPIEPTWYYKLAETVYQFYEKNSHLTAQTLYHLKGRSKSAFHYAPEIDLIDFPVPGKQKELDVACILDGQIVVGECKTGDLQSGDVAKFKTLASKMLKQPAKVVFSTTEESVTDAFAARAAQLGNSEILTFGDLYER
jgi:hypothetical protein